MQMLFLTSYLTKKAKNVKNSETRRTGKTSNHGHLRQIETSWNPMKSPCQGEGRGFESRLVLLLLRNPWRQGFLLFCIQMYTEKRAK